MTTVPRRNTRGTGPVRPSFVLQVVHRIRCPAGSVPAVRAPAVGHRSPYLRLTAEMRCRGALPRSPATQAAIPKTL